MPIGPARGDNASLNFEDANGPDVVPAKTTATGEMVNEEEEEELTCLQRFDDYMWNDNHVLFEEACTRRAGCCNSSTCVTVTRCIFLCAFITGWVFRIMSETGTPFDEARFLSQWGYFFSTILCMQALFFYPGKEIPERPRSERHSLCHGYKWFILMYNFTFTQEVIITLLYWSVLFPLLLGYAASRNIQV